MTEQSIANLLKQLRKTSTYSASEVVKRLKEYDIDISAKTLYGYESGLSMLNADVFVALCRIYKCDNPMSIFGNFSLKPAETSMIEKYRSLDDLGKEAVNYILEHEVTRATQLQELQAAPSTIIEFPRDSDTDTRALQYFHSVSAGTGQVIFDDVYADRILIPDTPDYRRAAYAVKVSGDSMEPLYHDGDSLLVEPTCEIEIGEIGIFNVGGQAYVKKLGENKLISLNKGYDDIPLTEDSKCMGRVIDKYSLD